MIEILLAVSGVVLGFSIGEFIAARKGLRTKKYKVKIEDIPKFLKEKFLAESFLDFNGKKISEGIGIDEFEDMMKKAELMRSNELLILSGTNLKYFANFDRFKIYIKTNAISLENFVEIWKIVKGAVT